eukprot:scaffold10139_cov80-Skeletonema_dohrnii-CCMP3373.AAC.1
MVRKEINDFVGQSEQNASQHKQVAHNDNQHGLYHTEKTSNMVMKARGNSSRGRCSAAGKESGRSSSGQRHSLDWSKHFHQQDTQLY